MASPNDSAVTSARIPLRDTLLDLFRTERQFMLFIGVALIVAGVVTPMPEVARWVGFLLAAYSTVANDSIQTVGTFIASNEHRPWWVLWLFIGGVFLGTIAYGWAVAEPLGDVSFGRLSTPAYSQTPTSFNFFQVAAPIFLLILTRMRMPVSTTFLILSCFATEVKGITDVLMKSVAGYGVAFVFGAVMFAATARLFMRFRDTPAHPLWVPAQWISTAVLWSTWIMQDMANLAVYLPRQLSFTEYLVFSASIFLGLGILFYLRGDKIQRVVSEKSSVVDIRAATLVDFVYAFILFGFVKISTIPMSTTWVFIGLLAGRELALILMRASGRPMGEGLRLVGRDLLFATIGLVVSIAIAFIANPVFHDMVLGVLGMGA